MKNWLGHLHPPTNRAGGLSNVWTWTALSLVILFVVLVRIRLLNISLERDEGEFAYVARLMLEGIAPYQTAYVIKLPGTSAIYAASMAVFGQNVAAIHLGLLLANVVAIVLVFFLGKRWFGAKVGLIAGVTYALMSLSWGVHGSAAHSEQFLMPAALGGILLLLRGVERRRLTLLFAGGLLFGVAFLVKQTGIFFAAYGGLLLLAGEFKSRPIHWPRALTRVAVFGLGVILPFAILCLTLWHDGVFARFWYWSFAVAGGRWATWHKAWLDLAGYTKWLGSSWQWPFWVMAALALPFVYWMNSVRPVRRPFLVFCGLSIMAVSAGLVFQAHYFVLILPALGMVIGLAVVEAHRIFASKWPERIFMIVCGCVLVADHVYYFDGSLDQVATRIYPGNPFVEAAQVADYIKTHSAPDSQIAVLGSEPEIYFLADRRAATGHLSVYILMEKHPYAHAMQKQMIDEIETARPEYIVFVPTFASWLRFSYSDDTLLQTMIQYLKDNYTRMGVAVRDPLTGEPQYYWGADAQRSFPDWTLSLSVYKLRTPSTAKE